MPLGYGQLDRELAGDGPSPVPMNCANCGYDLRGSASARCPECGHITLRKEAAQQSQAIKRALEEYKEAIEWGRRGMIVGAVGLALAGWGMFLPSGWLQPLLRVISLIAGPIAFFLGLSVIRAKNYARLTLDEGENAPSHVPSGAAILLGAANGLCAIVGPW